jgi:hypothetical protein
MSSIWGGTISVHLPNASRAATVQGNVCLKRKVVHVQALCFCLKMGYFSSQTDTASPMGSYLRDVQKRFRHPKSRISLGGIDRINFKGMHRDMEDE